MNLSTPSREEACVPFLELFRRARGTDCFYLSHWRGGQKERPLRASDPAVLPQMFANSASGILWMSA